MGIEVAVHGNLAFEGDSANENPANGDDLWDGLTSRLASVHILVGVCGHLDYIGMRVVVGRKLEPIALLVYPVPARHVISGVFPNL